MIELNLIVTTFGRRVWFHLHKLKPSVQYVNLKKLGEQTSAKFILQINTITIRLGERR